MRCLQSDFSDRISSRRPSRSPDLKSSDSYLYCMLKHKMYHSNSHTEDELKENIQHLMYLASPAEHRSAIIDVFVGCLFEIWCFCEQKETTFSTFYKYAEQKRNINCNILNLNFPSAF